MWSGGVATVTYAITIGAWIGNESWVAIWTRPNVRWQLAMELSFAIVLAVGMLFSAITPRSRYRLPSVLGTLAVALVGSMFLISTLTPHSGTASVFTSMLTGSVVSGVVLSTEGATILAQQRAGVWWKSACVCGGLLVGFADGVFFIGLAPFW